MALSVTISTPSASSSVSSDDGQAPQSPISPVNAYPASNHMSSSKAKGNIKNTPSLNKALTTKAKPKPAENPTDSSSTSTTNATAAKRKPSRRANTAERRATHNMVERQRRETLNGRFLDLSHLLPNLSQIRRPSKSSIVNSSIAHIQASKRHRLLASRVCLALAAESDALMEETEALKRELNEWRDRAGLPRVALRDKDQVASPARGEGYRTIIGGELEVVMAVGGEEGGDEDEDGENKYGGYSLGADVDMEETPQSPVESDQGEPMMAGTNPFAHNLPTPPATATVPKTTSARPTSARPVSAVSASSRRHSVSQNGPPGHEGRRSSVQMHPSSAMTVENTLISVPSSGLAFENPAMGMSGISGLSHGMYEHPFSSVSPQLPGVPFDKYYGNEVDHLGGQRSLFTPPTSSHGLIDRRERKERSSNRDRERETLLFMQRQHQVSHQHHNSMTQQYAQAQAMMLHHRGQRETNNHHFGCRSSPDGDDCSSASSCHSARPRSNSGSAYGSGYGSPDDRWGSKDLMVPSADGGRYDNGRGRYDVGFDLPLNINIPLGMNGLGMGNMGGIVDMDHDFSSPEYENPLTPEEFDVPRRSSLRM